MKFSNGSDAKQCETRICIALLIFHRDPSFFDVRSDIIRVPNPLANPGEPAICHGLLSRIRLCLHDAHVLHTQQDA